MGTPRECRNWPKVNVAKWRRACTMPMSLVVLGRRGLDQHVAPEGELVQQPLALVQMAAGADDDDLLVHGDGRRAEERVQADDRVRRGPGASLRTGLLLEAGDVGQDAGGRKVRGDLGGDGRR